MSNKRVLVLRTCEPDGTSYAGFKWPRRGPVKCSDWKSTPECGYGLHGLLWGAGNLGLLSWSRSSIWLVVSVLEREIVKIDNDKVKFPRGNVVYTGTRKGATDYIYARAPRGMIVGAAVIAVGDDESATVGACGSVLAGHRGTAVAGECGTAVAGGAGYARAGRHGTAIVGWEGVAIVADQGIAYAPTTGYVMGGEGARLVAGPHSEQVGKNGIKRDTLYRLGDDLIFLAVPPAEAAQILNRLGQDIRHE